MKIGVIGSGHIGTAISRHWAQAGHDLFLSAKHREKAENLAKELGPKAHAGTPEEAARQGEVVLLTIPFGEIPKLSQELRDALKGKIVMDTCNPYPERDGKVAEDVIRSGEGTGPWTAKQLPGARIVRAFNSVHSQVFESQAHRKNDPIGVPLASDDTEAMQVVSRLVKDAGFAPIQVGKLSECRQFDVGSPSYGSDAPASELKQKLKISGKAA